MTSENRELVLSTIKNSNLPQVEEIDDDFVFAVRCNGGELIKYHSRGIYYEVDSMTKWSLDHDGKEVPNTVIYFTHPSGKKAAIIVDGSLDNKNEIMAAAEITDPLCLESDCRGGANCLAKKLKIKPKS